MLSPDQMLIRCSEIHSIMTDPKKKTELISAGAKTFLIDQFVEKNYERREEPQSKYLEKGNIREQDALTLLSRNTKIFFKKNDQRLTNKYVTGEPDAFIGKVITEAEETFDTKVSWSANTFFRSKFTELKPDYFFQGVGYQWLTGSKIHHVAFCLINGTAIQIEDEKRRLCWKMGIFDPSLMDEAFVKKCQQIERNHIFDLKEFEKENPHFDFHNEESKWRWDIPKEERLHIFSFNRDETIIEQVQQKVINCREWMQQYLFKQSPERIEVEGV
jgi:hypothetical protein